VSPNAHFVSHHYSYILQPSGPTSDYPSCCTNPDAELAHAVLLAAQAKDPTVATPAAVGPPPYDIEYFNYNSMHLLSATTLATDPSSLLWYMDSAAFLHCTFDILDIVDPVLLPEPLPIGSANGGIIYATHSGRSHLSPLILVHYVPESKVKLISRGALTRQRFTYNIGRDRAITVLDPSGKHLFTCALQPNNVWTCPPILMAPPPTQRLLVAPTKEQLHEFLGHPNDEALKTVLNQGTFAQYSPLVSADVDLILRIMWRW
jgi:hypothetical protein